MPGTPCAARKPHPLASPTPLHSTPPTHPPTRPPAKQLLEKSDVFIRKQPKISGNYEQILGRSLEGLVNRAEELKSRWQVRAPPRLPAGLCAVCRAVDPHSWQSVLPPYLASPFCRCRCRHTASKISAVLCPPSLSLCLQDQYVSVEELVMAMADDPRFGEQLFREQVGSAVDNNRVKPVPKTVAAAAAGDHAQCRRLSPLLLLLLLLRRSCCRQVLTPMAACRVCKKTS